MKPPSCILIYVVDLDLIRILSSALSTVVAVSDYSQYFVRGLLAHPNADVRIKALRLLVVAPATTTPFSQNVLQHLSEHLHYIFGDNDPQNRSEVLSLIRKLIIRLRGGSSTLSKQTIGPPVLLEEPLKCHLDFLIWLLAFLENELGPSVSYQRHIMALTTLYYLMQSGLDSRLPRAELAKLEHNEIEWPFSLRLCPPNVLFSLVNLILDSFEDVRAATSRILRVFFKSVTLSNPAGLVAQQLRHGHGSVISLCNVPDNGRESNLSSSTSPSGMLDLPQDIRRFCIARAENLASQTNRADHADGTGRLYALNYLIAPPSSKSRLVDNMLKKLEEALTRWEDDLPNQLPETTLHGYLLALQYVTTSSFVSLYFLITSKLAIVWTRTTPHSGISMALAAGWFLIGSSTYVSMFGRKCATDCASILQRPRPRTQKRTRWVDPKTCFPTLGGLCGIPGMKACPNRMSFA